MKTHLLGLCLIVVALVLAAVRPARAGTIFQDNFSGPALDPAWRVLPGQGTYTLGASGLRYSLQGPQSSPAGWATTSLALALPFTGTDWVLTTQVAYSLDWCLGGSYTGPPVPNYGCSSGAQRPEVIVAFAPVTSADRSDLAGNQYALFDRGTDAWYGDNHLLASYGSNSVSNLLYPADANIVNNITGGTYWFQIARSGGSLSMDYSFDGVHYTNALSAQLADPSGSFNELLLTGTTFLSAGSFADFRSVSIATAAPEPGVTILSGMGLVGFSLLLRRRGRGGKG